MYTPTSWLASCVLLLGANYSLVERWQLLAVRARTTSIRGVVSLPLTVKGRGRIILVVTLVVARWAPPPTSFVL